MAKVREVGSLVTYQHPHAPMAEALRTLRTNLQFASIDKPIKSLSVTSATPEEGKSTISCNLAVVYAQAGKKVLLIDADLRKPTVHKIFGITNIVGLSSVIIGAATVGEAVQETAVEGLSVLMSGPLPPNPAEIVGTNRMKQLIAELGEDYDIIIVDTPPVAAVSDPLIVSTIVDGTVLVVAHGQANREIVQQAVAGLRKVKANLLGVVMNQVPVNGAGYTYYQYYGQK